MQLSPHQALWLALGAVLLWASLSALGVSLAHVPPFLLTGLGLLVGGIMALPINGFKPNNWRVPLPLLALGIYGLFGFHFLLFLSLRLAPPVATNLINYLWPLGIVVMAPLFLPSVTWRWSFAGAAVLGFGGAALAIVSGSESQAAIGNDTSWLGYALALGSAWIWASYSLLSKRATQLTTGHIGTFCMVSAAFALLCHALLEPATSLSLGDLWRIALLGLGPLGGSFFLWSMALRFGDARRIGLLAFLTPLLSTVMLLWQQGQALTWHIALAAALIVAGAWVGHRAQA